MASIWKQQKDVNNKPKRNNFDLSFQNHLTMKMGMLYPVFCKEVVPGDSFRINSAFGLKFMPLAFPTQTRIRANLQFFYVRNKNLWDRWEDFAEGLKGESDGVVHPYLDQSESFFRTGTLADYMNIPTTLATAGGALVSESSWRAQVAYLDISTYYVSSFFNTLNGLSRGLTGNSTSVSGGNVSGIDCSPTLKFFVSQLIYDNTLLSAENLQGAVSGVGTIYGFTTRLLANSADLYFICPFASYNISSLPFHLAIVSRPVGSTDPNSFRIQSVDTISPRIDLTGDASFSVRVELPGSTISRWNECVGLGFEMAFVPVFESGEFSQMNIVFAPRYSAAFAVDSLSTSDFKTPFSNTSDAVRINALPFRAYESIYNAYYRNTVNQPFRINGEVEYNKYITNNGSGADSTPYHLYKRNYELDFLTSALPSPQQGNAPLVGLSSFGSNPTITIEDESGLTTAKVDLDGQGTIVGLNVTSPIAGKEHAITLAQIASAGMNINDLRNTNALLHWLETNIRKGYRYLDFIAGHHNVTPGYRTLDMPEFIGGYSRDVNVSQIVSTADTLGSNGKGLGDFQGMANCFGGSKHSISHFCDDYGFIIGILCIVPTPAYSQLLPKQYLKSSPLDYFYPEFSQLGMQPITYEEVCPVQAYYSQEHDKEFKLTDTFGYQRPYYDLVGNVDEIHGLYRGELHNFLINRVFQTPPVLGNDFLQIDPDETNQIFADQNPDADNIIGQVVFDVKAKRPLPRVVIPSLGR